MPLILRSLLVALALFCGAQFARADTASPFGVGGPSAETAPSEAPPAAPPSFLRRAGVAVVMLQSRINRMINAQLMDIKSGDKPWALWGGLLIGFLYGVFHALGPGHGKSVIVGYFLGREAHPLRGIAMASWISLSHVIGAIVIVTVVHFILAQSLASPVDEVDGLRVFSYAAILLIGLGMLWSALRGGAHAHHHHAHAHGHDHGHGPHCAHVPGARKEQGLLGFAAGFIPCSGAILILVFALTNGIVWSGIAMTLAIAVGMAITLSVMGVSSILVRRQIVLRLPESAVAGRAFSLAGPILVTAIGAVLLCGALLLPTAS
ncbi:nickel/cobalt transporter [Dongia sedimenti]|uniref:Nickel/cobalt efflux system n=1 Tax=Dongia sedimenti TaxID=3064282 RepID=A0ABU0YGQ9_9PROT|nr:sulfite exporter TauE/SafE family protein [Rhodospirillaceae bacterium R-7]